MEIDMVLNELSIDCPAEDVRTAQKWMNILISTARSASRSGIKYLRSNVEINSLLLTKDYPLSKWRNDKQVDRELIRAFRSIATKYPLLDDLPELEGKSFSLEFFLSGGVCQIAWNCLFNSGAGA